MTTHTTLEHRIDTRPEGTLLCVLAEGKRPKFIYLLWRHPGVHTALCTYVFLWKTSVCTPGWRHMMAYFHVSTRKISDKTSSEWHFWSCIYSVTRTPLVTHARDYWWTLDFANDFVSPGVNSVAELVPSPWAYARNGARRRWLGDKIIYRAA
jgi:hypothetical protein